ncbi:uncharacterized protein A4U43_C01F1740 [Asparagus officinalis]|uniref:UBX domain-containing protein n=1 Tax=Asparagus officinalis TaxID=4686 RepID=A0A5P1FQN8_ASPOF|nr:plant UBX domain-containing protein 4-like [Asparagus officinalis]XP_020270880.1 plant UBX domain-containing protein 4-like [Asparagus officinalis]ONK78990.1 uncharacterized protein A4U43_C01F1740 [Asparagus officinalis]
MDSINNDDEKTLIETFISITSASREEALFFLESHNFELEPSIHSFYENSPIDQPLQDQEFEQVEDEIPQSAPPQVEVPAVSERKEEKKKKTTTGGASSSGRIRTLADLNRKDDDGSDSDDDGPQEYYTGGEKSGMLVQDPTKGGHNVDAIFDQARQMGATQGPFEQNPSSSSRSFTGTGRLLSGETLPAAPRPSENVIHNIYFWSNGFTIDDGPLRRFDDPANAAFLESIKKSQCPQELEPEDRRSTVHVNLVRREEACPEPVKRLSPFQGVGRTLGGGSSSTESVVAVAASSPSSAAPVVVDDSRPVTSIQLRLADGSRTVARFNTDHTVGNIRAFIDNHAASNGRAVSTNYSLQTAGFPPKKLTDATQTIEQAGLANSVVIQKL